MTSGDTQAREPLRRGVSDGVPRKPSFKCGGVGRGGVTHKSPRKQPSVQALAHKFNQLTSQAQGKRINGRPKRLKFEKEPEPEIVIKPTEPIQDSSCLPVQTAIGLFEKSSKPVATVKPILKPVEEKPKPKLAPKDSLNRAKYTVLRRTKDREVTNDDEQVYDDVANCKVPTNNGVFKATPIIDGEEIRKEVKFHTSNVSSLYKSVSKQVSIDAESPKQERNALQNISSLHRNMSLVEEDEEESRYMTTVQLRKKLSAENLTNLESKLEKYNIQVKQPEEEIKSNDKLNDIFAQISQSSVLARRGIQVKESKEVITSQSNNIFNKISQSGVTLPDLNRSGNDRKFVKLLKKEPEEPVVNVPNNSFLWSKQPSEEKSPVVEKPLPKPPELFIPDCCYESVDQNGDNVSDDGTEYDDISLNEQNDVYDDVGLTSVQHPESLYHISDKLDGNIYEDLDNFGEKGQRVQVYQKLNGDGRQNDLESVYDDANYSSMAARSDVSGLSGHSGQSGSSFEKVNSLYESAHSLLQHDSPTTDDGNYDVLQGPAGSDTTTSDGWVEMSDSETENPIQIEKFRKPKGGAKHRANWSQLQKITNKKMEQDVPISSDDDHVYERIPDTERSAKTDESLSSQVAHDDNIDDSSVDDFDSSEEDFADAQLPAEPVSQFQIAKSLRAAGKRIRQNLTLRKSDLSKSLKKLRPRLHQLQPTDGRNGGDADRNSKFYCTMEQLVGDAGGGSQTTTPTQRPPGPPPPPPSNESIHYADIRPGNASGPDQYTKYGLFKSSRSNSSSNSNWYADSGLYGVNGSSENGSEEVKKSLFSDEPLYQFYTECVNAQAREDILQHYDSDGYESINNFYSLINDKRLDVNVPMSNLCGFGALSQRSTPSYHDKNRKLWCQMPEVEESLILPTLTDQKRKLQEAKFEILTSEGSYVHSLNVLETHFMSKLAKLISDRDFKLLFSNILEVKAKSEQLLNSLEECWLDNIMLIGICDIVRKYAEKDFEVYIQFCKHHSAAHKTLMKLKETNPTFSTTLKQLENSPACQSLPLMSFLMLPAQRITRLPLLMRGVLARLNKEDDEFATCEATFDILNRIVNDCNNEASRMEKCEEMLLISQQLDFPKTVRCIPILGGNRCLIKRGEAILLGKEDSKLTFGRRTSKISIQLILLTDLLVIARIKGSRGNLEVIDHCPRNLVQLDLAPPVGGNATLLQQHKNLVMLTLLENHENKTVEMMISFAKESDPPRWRDAVSPVLSTNPDESIYEAWDCPQVIAIYDFAARQPDELALCIGDVVNVHKKVADGLYQGERLRDGVVGWFPSTHTQEISSAHIRAKNKKQRYKLLTHADSFIQQMKLNSSA